MVEIREATKEDAPAILAMARAYSHELGLISHHHAWLAQQIDMGELFIAINAAGEVVGFVSFHHNLLAEDEHTSIYYLCTDAGHRGKGIGKLLMDAVASDARLCGKTRITLKCPSHLPANHFYESIGYTMEATETKEKGGRLNVWTLSL